MPPTGGIEKPVLCEGISLPSFLETTSAAPATTRTIIIPPIAAPQPFLAGSVVGALVAGAFVVGALVVGASVTGALVTGASVTGASVTGASVTGGVTPPPVLPSLGV